MDDEKTAIVRSFLLQGLSPEEASAALALLRPRRETFRRGEKLFSPQHYPKAMAILLKGRCDVVQEGSGATINTLQPGQCFGVISLFSARDTYPTSVVARKETEAVFLEAAQVEAVLRACPGAAMNMIRFLSGRVEFLNDMVSTYTQPSVERRLAAYLLEKGADGQPFTMNRKLTAETLHCGRASLYRALESLTASGYLEWQGKECRLTDRPALERMISS